MGTVLLKGGHNSRSALHRWPELDPNRLLASQVEFTGRKLDESSEGMLLAMLRAMVEHKDLNVTVSLHSWGSTDEKQRLYVPVRIWGWLWEDDPTDPILELKYDTRFNKTVPYNNLSDWLETEWPDGVGVHHPDYVATCQLWQDSRSWHRFFKRRINHRATLLSAEANKLTDEAARLREVAERLARRR
jgi:hypothetical protein